MRPGTALDDRLDHDYLVGLKGIGPYAAAHCRMLLHDFSRIPVDSVVVAHLRERHDTDPAAFIAARAECGIYLGLGYRLMRLREKFQVAQVDICQPAQSDTDDGLGHERHALRHDPRHRPAAPRRRGDRRRGCRSRRSPAELAATPDDRYLSQMSLRIFRAGLKHSLVDAKWPAFEEVFAGFDPRRVRAMSDEAMEALLGDTRLIRHWGKLKSVRDNAAAMLAVAEEHRRLRRLARRLAGRRHRRAVGRAGASGSARWAAIPARPFCAWSARTRFILSPSVVAGLKRWAGMDAAEKPRRPRRRRRRCSTPGPPRPAGRCRN